MCRSTMHTHQDALPGHVNCCCVISCGNILSVCFEIDAAVYLIVSVSCRFKVAQFGGPGSAPNQPALKMSIKGKFKCVSSKCGRAKRSAMNEDDSTHENI